MRWICLLLCAFVAGCKPSVPSIPSTPSTGEVAPKPVVEFGDKVLAMKVPGKIDSVIWSVQRSDCFVKIQFAPVPSQPPPKDLATQVWLLQADGSTIPQRTWSSSGSVGFGESTTAFVNYLFPPSAATDAVAVVVMVDGQFFVESLREKPN